jgi:peroxiredoxin Q/BCP
MIKLNTQAPDFSLLDQDDVAVSLADAKGKWLLLYFYPKDDTPGCTQQACLIRDNWQEFQSLPVVVWGVSADSPAKHKKFIAKYELPFRLLSDESHTMLEAYGVWQEKKFMGRRYMGIARTSVLIDQQGLVRRVYEDVKPAAHADQVLADLKELTR